MKGRTRARAARRHGRRAVLVPRPVRAAAGGADYLRVAHEFHTLVLDGIPVMDFDQRNEAKRFITLIDTLYDNAVKLVASADAEPDALYRAATASRRRSSSAPRRG